MTIWYARKTGNIDASEMWNDAVDGSGNWLTWANLDPADTLRANEFIVTINVDVPECLQLDSIPRVLADWDIATPYVTGDRVQHTPTSGSLRQYRALRDNTGVTPPSTGNNDDWEYVPGGHFTASPGEGVTRIVDANVVSGTNGSTGAIQNEGAGSVEVTGSVTAGSVITSVFAECAYGARNNSSGTINVGGDSNGGSGWSAHGAVNNSTGTVNIAEDSNGGSGTTAHGAVNNSSGIINVGGDSTGGSGWSAYGAVNNSSGIINVGGDSTGGPRWSAHGAVNFSSGTINVGGDSVGHSTTSTAFGTRNNEAGTIHIGGNITKQAAEGYSSANLGSTLVLDGTAPQIYDSESTDSIGNLILSNTHIDGVTFASDVECEDYTVTGPGKIRESGGSRLITVNGNFAANGTQANRIYWIGVDLVITGTAIATWISVQDSDASAGTVILTENSWVDNSPGWSFEAVRSAAVPVYGARLWRR